MKSGIQFAITTSAALLLAGTLATPAPAQTQAELAEARKTLEEGSKRFMDLMAKVTDDQWNVRVSGITHTIGEEVEHISLSENDLQQVVANALKEPADPNAPEELADKHEVVREVLLGEDATAERFKYQDKIADRRDFMEYYPPAHDRLMKLFDGSSNLAQHVYKHPSQKIGRLHAVQWFYYIAYHRERHVRQIEALLAHPDMPGSHKKAD